MMKERETHGNFDLKDLKEAKEQFGKLMEEAKKAEEANNGKETSEPVKKQPLWKKIISGIIVVVVLGLIGFLMIQDYLRTFFLPKNSVTVKVVDQNGAAIDNLLIEIRNDDHDYTFDFGDDASTNITKVDVIPGDYDLYFRNVPEGYSCPTGSREFTLEEDGKVLLEYECDKK